MIVTSTVVDETEYVFCCGLFTEKTTDETWIQCIKCFKRTHTDRANIDEEDAYICDFCLRA